MSNEVEVSMESLEGRTGRPGGDASEFGGSSDLAAFEKIALAADEVQRKAAAARANGGAPAAAPAAAPTAAATAPAARPRATPAGTPPQEEGLPIVLPPDPDEATWFDVEETDMETSPIPVSTSKKTDSSAGMLVVGVGVAALGLLLLRKR
jgi:hypothetical protein